MSSESKGMSFLKVLKSYSDFHPTIPILHKKKYGFSQKSKMGNENQGLFLLKTSKSYSDFHPTTPILHNKNQSLAQKLKMDNGNTPRLRASKSYSNFHSDIYDGQQFELPPTVNTRSRSRSRSRTDAGEGLGPGEPNWELEPRRIWSEPSQKMTIRLVPQDSPPQNSAPAAQPRVKNKSRAPVPGYRRDTKAFAAKRTPFAPSTPKRANRFWARGDNHAGQGGEGKGGG